MDISKYACMKGNNKRDKLITMCQVIFESLVRVELHEGSS